MRKTILILSYIANVIMTFVFLGANWSGEKSFAVNRCCALVILVCLGIQIWNIVKCLKANDTNSVYGIIGWMLISSFFSFFILFSSPNYGFFF